MSTPDNGAYVKRIRLKGQIVMPGTVTWDPEDQPIISGWTIRYRWWHRLLAKLPLIEPLIGIHFVDGTVYCCGWSPEELERVNAR